MSDDNDGEQSEIVNRLVRRLYQYKLYLWLLRIGRWFGFSED